MKTKSIEDFKSEAFKRHILRSLSRIPCWKGWSPVAGFWLTGDLRFDYLPDNKPCITFFHKGNNINRLFNPKMHEVDPKTVHLVPNDETDLVPPSFVFLQVCEYLKEEPEAVKMFRNFGMFMFNGEIDYENDFIYKYKRPIFPVPYKDGFWDSNKMIKELDDNMKVLTDDLRKEQIIRTLNLLGAQS